jgi:hypothetical protein
MFRKMLFGMTAAVALAVPMAPMASASDIRDADAGTMQSLHGHYHIYIRRCEHERWRLYRTVDCHIYAHDLERSLQYRGWQVFVEHHD